MNTLYDSLMETGKANPERLFAELEDGRTYSYGDLEAMSARFAAHLVSLGLAPGDRLAAQVEKSFEAVLLYLACVRAGGVFLPLNTAYTPKELSYFLQDAKPALFVGRPGEEDKLRPIADAAGASLQTLGVSIATAEAGSLFDGMPPIGTVFQNIPRSSEDLAAILYTSGTTGRSKGAMLSHDNLLSNAKVLVDYWQFRETDRLLHALPVYHTHGLFVAINTSLLAGSSLIFQSAFKVDAVVARLSDATVMMGVPTFYTRLLEDARLTRDLVRNVRLFISGSAPLLSETHQAFEARTGHRILERYGMTETNMNTSNPYAGERRAGTVGFPLPGTQLRVVDGETGQEISQGEIGMVEVKGPNVFQGYWQMPEKTRSEFRDDGFFITGDLGKVDADGYLHIVGRGKDLIISGGLNIYSKEIELLVDALPGVKESAVIGVPHTDFGEGVVAVVVPDGSKTLEEAELMAALFEEIAKFKQPKRYIMMHELPRNTMGKVQKAALREAYKDLFA